MAALRSAKPGAVGVPAAEGRCLQPQWHAGTRKGGTWEDAVRSEDTASGVVGHGTTPEAAVASRTSNATEMSRLR